MVFTPSLTLALAVAWALVPAVNAQSSSSAAVPACALSCVLKLLPFSPCVSVTNLTCICTNAAFQLNYYNCQESLCSTTDLTAAQAYGVQACQGNGTPINVTSAPSGYSGSSGAGASVTSSGSIRSTTSAAATATSALSSKSTAVASGASGAAPAAASSKAAEASRLVAVGALGGLLVGGVALLF